MDKQILNFPPESDGLGLSRAKVLETGSQILLLKGNRVLKAELSASLLLAPAPGDAVLIFEDAEGAYVLSVLSRERAAEPGALRLPEKTALCVRGLDLTAASLKVRSVKAELKASEAVLEGGVLSLRFSAITQIAGRMAAFARNLLCRSKSLELRAKSSSLKAQRISLSAAEDLRAEAELIDLNAGAAFNADGKAVNIG